MEGGHHVIMACRSMDRYLHISPTISALHMACNEPWQLMGRTVSVASSITDLPW